MAPPSGLHQSAIPSDFEAPFPPLVRSSTVPASLKSHRIDPSHLAPEDAYSPVSPPRRSAVFENGSHGFGNEMRSRHARRSKDNSRSRSRRRGKRKRFQKLLWVKQSCRIYPAGLKSYANAYTERPIQTPTTTPIKPPSSRTSNATRASSRTIFGH